MRPRNVHFRLLNMGKISIDSKDERDFRFYKLIP